MAHHPQISPRGRKKPAYVSQRQVWVPAAHASNHRRKWPGRGRLLLAVLSVVLFSLAAVIGLTAATLVFYYSDLIFPGAEVVDIPIGSYTQDQAARLLAYEVPRREVLLVHSSGAWPVTVADLGLNMDIEATMEKGFDLGRSLPGMSSIVSGDLEIEPQWTLDEERANILLNRLVSEVSIPAVNAQVVIEDGQARAVPPQDGLVLDLEMTLAYLRENPSAIVRSGHLPLATHAVEAEITSVDVLVTEAQRFLSKQVTIRAYDPILDDYAEWDLAPRDWQQWLTLVVTPGESEPFNWLADEAAAQVFLASNWPWLGEQRYLDAGAIVPEMFSVITSGRTGLDARVYHQPQQHTVRPGESFSSIGYNYGIPYPWVQASNPGITTLSVGDVVTIPSPDDMLPLPVVTNKRVVVSLSQQRAQVFEDGRLKWDWPASTGISNSPTSPGIFQIQSHEPEAYAGNWDLYMPHFMGIYRPIPASDFMNGFHGFPNRDGFNLLWTDDLGTPVTYGCILLSSENAQQLYEWAEEGVVVEIER